MELSGVHLLLTYQCNLECDHCFVWGSPRQSGTMTLVGIDEILRQTARLGTVEWIYFEGGEPFLYYPVLLRGVRQAVEMGFRVGAVTNSYWALGHQDALEWLRPLAGQLDDLSVSSDVYHWDQELSQPVQDACAAAAALDIPVATIAIAQPEATDAAATTGQLPPGVSGVMYRGRAAEKLAGRTSHRPWEAFNQCPHEDLREPGRVHIDPLGYVEICHGIAVGNVFRTELAEICRTYRPESHPIAGPLLTGGPAELVRRYGLDPATGYADACHLCDAARRALRRRFPDELAPDQMYGV